MAMARRISRYNRRKDWRSWSGKVELSAASVFGRGMLGSFFSEASGGGEGIACFLQFWRGFPGGRGF